MCCRGIAGCSKIRSRKPTGSGHDRKAESARTALTVVRLSKRCLKDVAHPQTRLRLRKYSDFSEIARDRWSVSKNGVTMTVRKNATTTTTERAPPTEPTPAAIIRGNGAT